MTEQPDTQPSADAGGFEAWARGNEDVIYESDYQLARRAWNAATHAAQQQHASETAAYDSEILRLQDQEAHFARKAHSYEIANMGLDQRVERLTADLQAAQQRAERLAEALKRLRKPHRPDEWPGGAVDCAACNVEWPCVTERLIRAILATPPTPTSQEEPQHE